MICLIDEPHKSSKGARARDRPVRKRLSGLCVVQPLNSLFKQNSFSEKTSKLQGGSEIKTEMQTALAACQDDENFDSPSRSPTRIRRGRGMTEGVDDLSINVLNANTTGMIQHKIGQLHRQKTLKKQELLISGESDKAFFFNCQLLELERADSVGLATTAVTKCVESAGPHA